jgi:hypothetical protein
MKTGKLRSILVACCAFAWTLSMVPETHAAKESFERKKPHVNVGTIHIEGQAGELRVHALFWCNVIVQPNGLAGGVLSFRFQDGSVVRRGDVVRLVLALVRTAERRSGNLLLATIAPDAAHQFLLFDITDPLDEPFEFGPVRVPEGESFHFTVEGRIDIRPPPFDVR